MLRRGEQGKAGRRILSRLYPHTVWLSTILKPSTNDFLMVYATCDSHVIVLYSTQIYPGRNDCIKWKRTIQKYMAP